jgi:hypothetical protein
VNPVRPNRAYTAAAMIPILVLAITGSASAVQTLVGVDSVRFAWAPASGTVSAYQVYVGVNGATPVAQSVVTSPEATIPVSIGDQIAVQVAALKTNPDGSFTRGPKSALSDSISILASPRFPVSGAWILRCATCPALARRSLANASLVVAEAPGLRAPWRVLGNAKLQYGRDQIIWHNLITGQMAVYDGQFLAPITSLTTTGPSALRAVGAADLNNDGNEEFIAQRTDTGVVMVWGVNSGRFENTGTIQGPTTSRLVSVTDFDRDGKVDLLWQDTAAGTLDLWKMAKNPTLQLALTTLISKIVRVANGVPTGAAMAATGDFNGDSNLDVLWRYSDGRFAISYLIAGVPSQYVVLTPVAGDINLNVLDAVDVGGTAGAEIAMQDNLTGLIWIVDPSASGANTRTKVVHAGSDWKVVGTGS